MKDSAQKAQGRRTKLIAGSVIVLIVVAMFAAWFLIRADYQPDDQTVRTSLNNATTVPSENKHKSLQPVET